MSQIVLQGPRGFLVAGRDAWDELLKLAGRFGWRSAFPQSHYRADIDLKVDATDAYGIACALRDAAESLIRNETTATVPNLPELIGDISELTAFCCDGGFQISWQSEEAPEADAWLTD